MRRLTALPKWGRLSLGLLGVAAITTFGLARCGSSSSGGSSTVAVAGIISQASRAERSTRGRRHGKTLDLSTLSVYCVTFATPPTAGTGTVSADGHFSLSMPANTPFGCFILQGTTQLATLVIKDTSSTGMNGSASTTSLLSASGDTNLGTVSLDTVTGEATADKATITGTITPTVSATGVTDFTGSYTIAAVDSTTAASFPGYTSPCAVGASDCHGPQLGQPIYVKILHGTAFTPDATCTSAVQTAEASGPNPTSLAGATCNGTAGGDKYGIMVWASQNALTSCGSKLGFYYAQAKVHANIDLSTAGLTEGPMTWTSSAASLGLASPFPYGNLESNAAHLGYGWADTAVTFAQGNYGGQAPQDCQNVTIGSTYNGSANPHAGQMAWACRGSTDMTGATANSQYMLNLQGGGSGCYLTGNTSAYVNPTSNGWTTLNGVSGTNVGPDAGGMNTNTKSAASVEYQLPNSSSTATGNVTCVWTGGQFSDQLGTTPPSGSFNTTHVLAASSTGCDTSLLSGSGALQLSAMQCLANSYQQIEQHYQNVDTVCLPQVRFNWGASSAQNYLLHNGPQQALTQFVLELFNYTSNTSGTFTQSEDDQMGAQWNGNWITCQTHRNTTMNVSLIPNTTNLLATFVQSQVVTDSNPACQAAQVEGNGTMYQIFQLTHAR